MGEWTSMEASIAFIISSFISLNWKKEMKRIKLNGWRRLRGCDENVKTLHCIKIRSAHFAEEDHLLILSDKWHKRNLERGCKWKVTTESVMASHDLGDDYFRFPCISWLWISISINTLIEQLWLAMCRKYLWDLGDDLKDNLSDKILSHIFSLSIRGYKRF